MSVYPIEHIWHELVRTSKEYRAQIVMFFIFAAVMIIAVRILLFFVE